MRSQVRLHVCGGLTTLPGLTVANGALHTSAAMSQRPHPRGAVAASSGALPMVNRRVPAGPILPLTVNWSPA